MNNIDPDAPILTIAAAAETAAGTLAASAPAATSHNAIKASYSALT